MSNSMIPAAGAAMPADAHKTRRALLRIFGAVPALAILPAAAVAARAPAAAPSIADPIFAAIERDKAARAFWNEESKVVDEWCAAHREKLPGWEAKCDLVTKADFDRSDAAWKIMTEAREALHETVPLTVGGVRALLEYTTPSVHTVLKSPLFASILATEV